MCATRTRLVKQIHVQFILVDNQFKIPQFSFHDIDLKMSSANGHFVQHSFYQLTHLLLVSHICVTESGQHWFRKWLVAYSAPSHYPNQRWVIVNWDLRNKRLWNFDRITKLLIHENASENVVYEMAAILSSGRWVKRVSVLAACLIFKYATNECIKTFRVRINPSLNQINLKPLLLSLHVEPSLFLRAYLNHRLY